MQDFNSFSKNSGQNNQQSLIDLVTNLSNKFDGKSQDDLYRAILQEAEKGKKNGTLSNQEIDNFVRYIEPFLDDKKRKMLYKVADKIKKI